MKKTTWAIDPSHSEIQFKVKHLLISTLSGQFTVFSASIVTEGDDFTTAQLAFKAEVSSINTNNEQRDAHLLAVDFFDQENHPDLTFSSTRIVQVDDDEYQIYGILNMKGVNKEIVLDAELGGTTKDAWGNTRLGLTLSGKVNRKDFGISFSMLTETGGIALGEEVKLAASVQFIKEAVLVNA